jgi:hypothetical protein
MCAESRTASRAAFGSRPRQDAHHVPGEGRRLRLDGGLESQRRALGDGLQPLQRVVGQGDDGHARKQVAAGGVAPDHGGDAPRQPRQRCVCQDHGAPGQAAFRQEQRPCAAAHQFTDADPRRPGFLHRTAGHQHESPGAHRRRLRAPGVDPLQRPLEGRFTQAGHSHVAAMGPALLGLGGHEEDRRPGDHVPPQLDLLQVAARVPGGLDPVLAELSGAVDGRDPLVVAGAAAALQGIARQELEMGAQARRADCGLRPRRRGRGRDQPEEQERERPSRVRAAPGRPHE